MGTNYYTRHQECKHCGRYEDIHLGKSSAGWHFSFQYNGGRFYKDVYEMKIWLKDKTITNEYGDSVSYDDFWAMIEKKQSNPDNLSHYHESKKSKWGGNKELLINGYSFTDCEFS